MRNFKVLLTSQELGLQPGYEFCAVTVSKIGAENCVGLTTWISQ
jgi:hypothetical protein